MENFKISMPSKNEWDRLLEIWESAVRATHHFLKEGDVEKLKAMIVDMDLFAQVDLNCIRDADDNIVAFTGIADRNIEMLFVHPDYFGKGIGKMLLEHAIQEVGANKVDVNEQNEQAVNFYKKLGFKVMSRSELDGQGNPYPLLNMELI